MLRIDLADLGHDDVRAFVIAHLHELRPTGPPESAHALDLAALGESNVQLWVGRDEHDAVAGMIALARLSADHAEVKSMRTSPAHRGRGVGTLLLDFLLGHARTQGMTRVSLETGSADFFAPARALYHRAGFVDCDPFGGYTSDPNSVFMTLRL